MHILKGSLKLCSKNSQFNKKGEQKLLIWRWLGVYYANYYLQACTLHCGWITIWIKVRTNVWHVRNQQNIFGCKSASNLHHFNSAQFNERVWNIWGTHWNLKSQFSKPTPSEPHVENRWVNWYLLKDIKDNIKWQDFGTIKVMPRAKKMVYFLRRNSSFGNAHEKIQPCVDCCVMGRLGVRCVRV